MRNDYTELWAELQRLREENERLKVLLQRNGIDIAGREPEPISVSLSLEEKVELFRSLFHGREDVFARRWVSPSTGKSGYQPVCKSEWSSEYCDKKKYKCSDCPNRDFKPLVYDDIYQHLEGRDSYGRDVVGVYAIFPDNSCRFLCCDFDDKSCEQGYVEDVQAYVEVCRSWGIPAYIEKSRSGNGAHVWILFSEPVKAREARRLGNAILTEAMKRNGRMSFKSYDRFFPNQDYMPSGGFGNLVALPLQGNARKKGNSVFVDDNFRTIVNQWDYLRSMSLLSAVEVDGILQKYGSEEPLGELSKSTEEAPWERPGNPVLTKAAFPKTNSSLKIYS